jgi:HEAT repeat protein
LASLGGSEALPVLARMLKDENDGVRIETLKALKQLEDPRAVAAILPCVDDASDSVRAAAVEALSSFDSFRDPAPFIAALRHAGSARQKAAEALGKLGDPRGIAPVIDALGDYRAKWAANSALKKFPDRERVVTELAAAVRGHANNTVREQCASLLGEMEAKSALPALREAARSQNRSVARAAENAVKRIASE